MAQFTAAYSSFLTRLAEVDLLMRRGKDLEAQDAIQNSSEVNAICRAGVVLLSSHIEGYVKDVGEVALDRLVTRQIDRSKLGNRFFHTLSALHFEAIRDTSDPEKLGEKMFEFLGTDGIIWSKVGPLPNAIGIDRFAKGFASPSLDKISSFMMRFGYRALKHDLGHGLARDYLVVTNMLENIVSTRNDIAHGNLSITKTPNDLEQMIIKSKQFIVATDKAFAGWFSTNYCSIR